MTAGSVGEEPSAIFTVRIAPMTVQKTTIDPQYQSTRRRSQASETASYWAWNSAGRDDMGKAQMGQAQRSSLGKAHERCQWAAATTASDLSSLIVFQRPLRNRNATKRPRRMM